MRFGRLLVVEPAEKIGGHTAWTCICDCGKRAAVKRGMIQSGLTKSCGCLQAESRMTHGHTKGKSKSSEYHSWSSMRDRCTNPNAASYENYGGRGITVCEEWMSSFDAFMRDMGPKPTIKHSIDRIDNDGGYNKDNCVWSNRKVQASNRRPIKPVTVLGVLYPSLKAACAAFGTSPTSVWDRQKRGVPFEIAVTHKFSRWRTWEDLSASQAETAARSG